MATSLSTERVRHFWRDLQHLLAESAKTEEALVAGRAREGEAIGRAYAGERERLAQRREAERQAAEAQHCERRNSALARAEAELKSAKSDHAKARDRAIEQFQTEEEAADQSYTESRWTLDAIHEAHVKKAKSACDLAKRQLAERNEKAAELKRRALARFQAWSLVPPGASGDEAAASAIEESLPRIEHELESARTRCDRLERLWAPRLIMGDRWLWLCFAAWIVFAGIGAWLWTWYYALAAALGAVAIVGTGLYLLFLWRARTHAGRIAQALFRSIAVVERLCSEGDREAESMFQRSAARSLQQKKDELRKADVAHRRNLADALARRDAELERAEREWKEKSSATERWRDDELTAAAAGLRERIERLEEQALSELEAAEEKYNRERGSHDRHYALSESELRERWRQEVERLRTELAEISSESDRLFVDWSQVLDSRWIPPQTVPGGIRFGQMPIDIDTLEGGHVTGLRQPEFSPRQFSLPALLPFPRCGSALVHTSDAGRAASIQALQGMMMRYLTALPPGKVRFTIIDPVGLGENFAAFMHLADSDEQLVTSRIWTEPAHIERRLTDLTGHMENVIQKYLRNQYRSIEEYNAQAGEVAEPYRILVVANFPVNFSTDTARRLVSIASSGAACGVYVLVSVDSKQPLPQGFDLADLEQVCLNLSWGAGRYGWEDRDFGPLALTLDAPPGPVETASIATKVGKLAKEAGRVEVDFRFIEPAAESRWAADSRRGIRVPLGRAGATKRQYLDLGTGTAQHAVVAGKTGSGKSTLLHALITNLALHYGPSEVELYLIDFKKGVEFKTYAAHDLPHARVVAVESEREFGLSVLQRLDGELKRRGDLFRDAGVQDIASYRDKLDASSKSANGQAATLPRILLIVDEFQEFFIEDDKLSQEAALLLDRLVRQGRAFGLHVLLGSQTLGGAYSLARSTIDQMAVRIALQCSEADANLILAKDNSAARLLSRPGEAIYNDANGLIEGNDIFQVVWLPEERREVYLRELQTLAREKNWRRAEPQIVFEGNNPAEISGNARLRGLIEAGGADRPTRERIAWLGEALAIKEPTAAVFRRQSGSHLLIIGQNSDAARAMLTSAAIALVFQQPADERDESPAITILDGSPSDDPGAPWLAHLAAQFATDMQLVNLRDRGFDSLIEELERRKNDPTVVHAPRFLLVNGLHRFRDLRKTDDDFGFNRRSGEATASAADQFAELVREGPAHGIHLVVWCDSLTNVQRSLERRDLREFEQRVLFQMGIADSSTLIDSPAASRLGINRALYAAEELSTPEKFRPYRNPTESWLEWAASQWRNSRLALVSAAVAVEK